MPKRFSSSNRCMVSALTLARAGKIRAALRALRYVRGRHLSACDLRLAAQVNTRCGMLDAAENCWLEIERRNQMEPGDYYMFASLQLQFLRDASAARCYEREIEIAKSSGNDYFFSSSVIRLAELMLSAKNFQRARELLDLVGGGAGEYVVGIGFRTKVDILFDIDRLDDVVGGLKSDL